MFYVNHSVSLESLLINGSPKVSLIFLSYENTYLTSVPCLPLLCYNVILNSSRLKILWVLNTMIRSFDPMTKPYYGSRVRNWYILYEMLKVFEDSLQKKKKLRKVRLGQIRSEDSDSDVYYKITPWTPTVRECPIHRPHTSSGRGVNPLRDVVIVHGCPPWILCNYRETIMSFGTVFSLQWSDQGKGVGHPKSLVISFIPSDHVFSILFTSFSTPLITSISSTSFPCYLSVGLLTKNYTFTTDQIGNVPCPFSSMESHI